MRGFRASRAFQNSKSARFGRQPQFQVHNGGRMGGAQQPQQKELPDWLKMPTEPKVELKKENSSAKPLAHEPVAVKLVSKEPAVAVTKRPKAKARAAAPKPKKVAASLPLKPKKKAVAKSSSVKKRKAAA